MTPRRRRFIEAYAGKARGNASQAARIAGYSDAGTAGWRLLQIDEIQRAVETRLQKSLKRLGTDDLLKKLEAHVDADIAAYIEQKDYCPECKRYGPSFDLEAFREAGLGHLIQEMTINEKTGDIKVKLHSVQRAIDMLLKVGGAYKIDTSATETSLASIMAEALGGPDPEEEATH